MSCGRLGRFAAVLGATIATALCLQLPGSTASALPSRATVVTGTVQVVAADGPDDQVYVQLRSGSTVYSLPQAQADTLTTGTRVRVTGHVDDGQLRPSTIRVLDAPDPVLKPVTGTQSVYVIRAYWTQPDATTAGDVTAAFAKDSAYFRETSYGAFDIRTTVGADWRQMPAMDDCDENTLWDNAVAAETAADSSFRETDYDHVVVYFPFDGDCRWSGLGDIGGPQVWLNGRGNETSSLDPFVSAHELGHNLGLQHSNAAYCWDGQHETYLPQCQRVEYGDTADVMGRAYGYAPDGTPFLMPAEFNAYQKSRLGWLGTRAVTVAPCGSAQLAAYEAGTGTVAVRVVGHESSGAPAYTWLEWRQPRSGSVDDGLSDGLTDGVLIHEPPVDSMTADPMSAEMADHGPALLDGTPNSGVLGMADAALPYGHRAVVADGVTLTVGNPTGGALPITLSSTMPSAPQSVRVHVSGQLATVSWNPPRCAGAGALGSYMVQTSSDGGAWHNLGSTTRTALATRLTSHSVHRFRVIARNSRGSSGYSTVVTAAHTSLAQANATSAVGYGRAATTSVHITDLTRGLPIRNASVVLQRAAGRGWQRVATAVTGRTGTASVRVAPKANTRYRWQYAGTSQQASATSSSKTVSVRQVVRASAHHTRVRRGHAAVVYGVVSPVRRGELVRLQLWRRHRWVTTAVHGYTARRVLPDGRHAIGFSVHWRASTLGKQLVRIYRPATASNAAGTSAAIALRVVRK